MPRLLLVDDDRFVLRAIEKLLSTEGYYCQTAVNAEEAKRALEGEPFDMLVLDVSLPDQDGYSLCRQIRTRHTMPIIFLTARDDNSDKVVGLEVGGDDYLTKPFAPRELVARVRAHLRRASEYSSPPDVKNQIIIGDLIVDVDRRDVSRAGISVKLTEREYELMLLLARNREKALSMDWIFQNIWGYESELGVKTLAVYVRRLRRKIELDPDNPVTLITVRGFGYKVTSGHV